MPTYLPKNLWFKNTWRYLSRVCSMHLDEMLVDVEHKAVISELYARTEISASYRGAIVLSNLIALLGLLTNSVAVVIGAMLISPLMGPIFSLGLGFTMGDLPLARRATRIIVVSIILTVIVAALFTLISPLKEMTHEILARTRPNIYDLLIAIFAGIAGALALCTRKNYLFTTTGVAVATAVIPPLSVVGYGIGTWQAWVALGGFLLFFTNLVAIVISSNIVFYLLKFRGSMVDESRLSIRRRFQIMGAVLAIISIPLVYTLVVDLQKMKLSAKVERFLKAQLEEAAKSRLTDFSYQQEAKKITVQATINTVKYVGSEAEKTMEKALAAKLGQPVSLQLDQVIVKAGNVEPLSQAAGILPAAISKALQKPETLASLNEKTMLRIKDGCRELESFITPYKVAECGVRFSDSARPIIVQAAIARDFPLSEEEKRWLGVALEKALGEKSGLELSTVPLLPPIIFAADNQPDEASKKALAVLKQLAATKRKMKVVIELPMVKAAKVHHQAANLKQFIVRELLIPETELDLLKTGAKEIRVRVIEG